MKFSEDIEKLLKERYPNKDIYSMNLEELKSFRDEIENLRHEYSLLELANKLSGNGAYGASAAAQFYFFNVSLAADITGECRVLTKTMWDKLEYFFHETLWERKDLWEKFDFELDESKHDWYRTQPISVYSDTDSCHKNSLLTIKYNNKIQKISFEDLYNKLQYIGIQQKTSTGHEIIDLENIEVLNYVDGKIKFVPLKRLIRHKVSKSQFKIRTKSGKEIIVTGDHSCIVFRNGQKIAIKAKDINKETDKILSIIKND